VSFCTFKGEIIGTRSPVQKISTELVPSLREASAGMAVNSQALTQIFGGIPRGTENPVARRSSVEPAPPAPQSAAAGAEAVPAPGQPSEEKLKKLEAKSTPSPDSPKKHGIPGGTGIILKGQSEDKPKQ